MCIFLEVFPCHLLNYKAKLPFADPLRSWRQESYTCNVPALPDPARRVGEAFIGIPDACLHLLLSLDEPS